MIKQLEDPIVYGNQVFNILLLLYLDCYYGLLTTLHVRDWLQKLAASSTENSVPPTGAPNAADTPEAAPPDTKSRIS